MARIPINTGSQANDGTGDDLRSAFVSVNENFIELYAASPVSSQITIEGNEITTNVSNANLILSASGTGVIQIEGIQIRDNHIEGIRSNEDLFITPSGTGNIIAGALRINGTTISADDSTSIKINEILNVNTIASDDSSAILLDDDVNINGLLQVDAIDTNTIASNDSTSITINDSLVITGTTFAPTLDTNVISSGDSSAIQIQDSVNISGALTVAGGIAGLSVLNNSTQSDGTTSISSSTTTQVDSFDTATFRSAKYVISMSDTTNDRFEITEVIVTHGPSSDSTTAAFITSYGSVTNHTGPLSTFTADINDGNLRLLATNTSSDALVFKFVRTAINV